MASPYPDLRSLNADLVECRRCPRLVQWRERVAAQRRAAYADQEYWGRPVPGFGDPAARVLVVGLAPAAHGANRTGRMFTGDRSGTWLYRAMHRAGFASQPDSIDRDDGLHLHDAWVTAAVRCAPPGNTPTPHERDTCGSWLEAEWGLLADIRVVVCLGGFAYGVVWRLVGSTVVMPRPRPRFAHGLEVAVAGAPAILASFHPSQQNTFTGRLTEEMLDAVFARAAELAAG